LGHAAAGEALGGEKLASTTAESEAGSACLERGGWVDGDAPILVKFFLDRLMRWLMETRR
jgi:hypothetical protein